MPGMDGIEVLETLKYTLSNTEMIVATAFDKMDPAIRALQPDASDFITKPVNSEALPRVMTRAKFHYIAHKLNPVFPLHYPAGS
jgi:DNA-binding NtrC family response regulator